MADKDKRGVGLAVVPRPGILPLARRVFFGEVNFQLPEGETIEMPHHLLPPREQVKMQKGIMMGKNALMLTREKAGYMHRLGR
jgi:hypothetical protein